jgi:hypothetical protein
MNAIRNSQRRPAMGVLAVEDLTLRSMIQQVLGGRRDLLVSRAVHRSLTVFVDGIDIVAQFESHLESRMLYRYYGGISLVRPNLSGTRRGVATTLPFVNRPDLVQLSARLSRSGYISAYIPPMAPDNAG